MSFSGCGADEDESKHRAVVYGVLIYPAKDQMQGRKALVLYQAPTKIFFVASFQTWRRVPKGASGVKWPILDDVDDDDLLLQSSQQ